MYLYICTRECIALYTNRYFRCILNYVMLYEQRTNNLMTNNCVFFVALLSFVFKMILNCARNLYLKSRDDHY